MKKLYIEEPRLDDGCFVAYGKTDADEDCKVVWAIRDEYLNPEPDTFIPDDLQEFADWDNPTDVIIDNVYYFGKIELAYDWEWWK